MQTKQVNVYKFSELSKEVQKKVLDENQYILVELEYDLYYHEAKADFINICKGYGLDVDEVMYSGFCSQGDGLSFTGAYEKAKPNLRELKKAYGRAYPSLFSALNALQALKLPRPYTRDYSIGITRSGHYVHENTMSFAYSDYDTGDSDAEQKYLENVESYCKDIAKAFYRILEKLYDSLLEEDAVREFLKESEAEYLSDGSIYHETF